ncbi:hypothetical protein TL16_g09944 [Triparma laevis f. inornata]|nr:hypothetical protein TL16_g09944 [Triparma laevis f. inornata]
MENFRSPNFELVADVLFWMVKRYDPDITVHTAIESEDDRVEFLTSIAVSMQSKAGIKLNTKKLYAADGHAVKELLKVATTLYHASRYTEEDGGEEDSEVSAPVTNRLTDVKAARSLASEITERGARLHDLLKAEMDVRSHRLKSLRFLDAISGNLESGPEQQWVEKELRGIVESTKDSVDTMKKQVQDFDADEKALVEKIKRKQTDLERNKKRLASLQHVRPAFMDEYEKLERDLQKQYEVYLERFRNLDYLEHELDSLNKAEEEKAAEADRRMKRMQRILREEELKIIRGEQDLVLGDENSGGGSGNKQIFGSR